MTNPEVKKFYMAFIKESITSISRGHPDPPH